MKKIKMYDVIYTEKFLILPLKNQSTFKKKNFIQKMKQNFFVDTINVMRASNKVSLSEIQEGKKNIASCSNNCIGYYDGIYIYLIWEAAYAKANEFCGKLDDGFSFAQKRTS